MAGRIGRGVSRSRTSAHAHLGRIGGRAGEPLGAGAKALLLRTDDVFRLFVLPADLRLDSASVKRHLALKRLRFATAEELLELTGLVPGSVPPFGEPVLPFPLLADSSIGRRYEQVAFNAGTLTRSFIMTAADWRRGATRRILVRPRGLNRLPVMPATDTRIRG